MANQINALEGPTAEFVSLALSVEFFPDVLADIKSR
jgi:hypothetical protein